MSKAKGPSKVYIKNLPSPEGLEQTFEAVWDRYRDLIFRKLKWYCECTEVAEDITQVIFLNVWQVWIAGKVEFDKINGLIGTIANRRYKDYIDTCVNGMKPLSFDIVTEDMDGRETSMLSTFENKEVDSRPDRYMILLQTRGAIDQSLLTLKPQHREIFIDYYENDIRGTEVCEKYGISGSNLWVILNRSRNQLRNELLKHGIDTYNILERDYDREYDI